MLFSISFFFLCFCGSVFVFVILAVDSYVFQRVRVFFGADLVACVVLVLRWSDSMGGGGGWRC
jgi:hypothetical protein